VKREELEVGRVYACGPHNQPDPETRKVRVVDTKPRQRENRRDGVLVEHLDGSKRGEEEVVFILHLLHPWEEEVERRRMKRMKAEAEDRARRRAARRSLHLLVALGPYLGGLRCHRHTLERLLGMAGEDDPEGLADVMVFNRDPDEGKPPPVHPDVRVTDSGHLTIHFRTIELVEQLADTLGAGVPASVT